MTLNIRVIAPDKTVWDSKVDEVILPSSTGQLGILKGHAPLLTALDTGVMRVRIQKQWKPIFLFGGFAEVEQDDITILVNGAEQITDIDLQVEQDNLNTLTEQLEIVNTNTEKIEITQKLKKVQARIQACSQNL
jgi:F-type H+-transporting ATPase subunit epsilon